MQQLVRPHRLVDAVLVSIFAVLVPHLAWAQANGELQIHFIRVGQGDAALIVSPLGETMLIDSGPLSSSSCASATGIITSLTSIGLTKLDYHVASHYDADHIGCSDHVVARWPIQKVAYDRGSTNVPATQTYARYAAAVASRRQSVFTGQQIVLDAASSQPVIFEVVAVNGNGVSVMEENDRGVVLMLRFGSFDAEFGGDIGGSNLSGYKNIESLIALSVGQIELHKVHHHGSQFSSNASFLGVIQPKVAVLSVGSPNAYDHPTSSALSNLRNVGTVTYWTTPGDGASPVAPWDVVVNNRVLVSVPPASASFSVVRNGVADVHTVWEAPPPCSYQVQFPFATAPSPGAAGAATVTTGSDCSWIASSNVPWLAITSGASGSGNGTIGLSVSPNASHFPRSGIVSIADQVFTVTQEPPFALRPGSTDFDGDGTDDPGVYRHTSGQWFVVPSTGGLIEAAWGAPALGDTPVPADYDGDGQSDIAVFRGTTGEWLILRSSDSQLMSIGWGAPILGDTPVPADYDGDGHSDIAVYRTTTGEWFILSSSNSQGLHLTWGWPSAGDIPAVADYDGDGRADVAVYRLGTGEWFVRRSSDAALLYAGWGAPTLGDIPVVGDYDNDGTADVAVYRLSTGEWFVRRSSDAALLHVRWGAPSLGDIPMPADYDGDGHTDVAVFRRATGEWFIGRSSDGSLHSFSWGAPSLGDLPPQYP